MTISQLFCILSSIKNNDRLMSQKTKWLFISGIVLLIIGTMFFLGKPPSQNTSFKTIKIGAALGLTGDGASWAEMSLKGITMALDEINKKGGVDGKKIELVVEDTKSNAKDSISAVQKLITIDKVVSIVGPTWLDVYPGAQGVVENKNVILVSPDAGAEAVHTSKTFPNTFSSWYRSQPKVELVMDYLAKNNIKKIDIIHQNDSYYVDLGNRMEKEAKKRGIEIVRREKINVGEGDFKTLLTKIKTDDIDMTFFALYDQKGTSNFFKNRAALYPSLKIITDEFGQDYINNKEYQDYIDGIIFFSALRDDALFEKRFEDTFGIKPLFGASNAYDATHIIIKAYKNSPNDLAGYVQKKTFNTVTFGEMKFDEINGVDTKNQQFIMKKIEHGEAVVIH